MWRRVIAIALSLPGLAFLIAALAAPERPVAIVTLIAASAAVAIGRWRARRKGRALTVADYWRLGISGPAVALLTIVALENKPALALLQAAAGGAIYGTLATSAALSLTYARLGKLPGARRPRATDAEKLAGQSAAPSSPPPQRPHVQATGRIVDERAEGVTGRTEQECPHCGEWTLLVSPICRACGRSTIDTPVGAV